MTQERKWAAKRVAYVVGQLVVAAVVGFYVVRTVLDLLRTDAFDALRFDMGLAALSLALLAVYNLLFVHSSQLVLRSVGESVSYGDAFELTYVSALGKYLPGGIWHVVGRFALAEALKVRRRSVVVVTVFENALGVVSGILVAALGLGIEASAQLGLAWWLAPAIGVLSLAAMHPAVFGRLMKVGLKMAGGDAELPELSFWRILALVVYRAAGWFVAGLGLLTYTRALYAGATGSISLYSGAFAAASVFGLLVIFTPGGIGVREATLVALLTPTLGPGVAGTVGLTSRVWSTAVELGLSGAALAVSARRVRRSTAAQ